MLTFFTIVHVLLCVFMVFVILLQPGKDAGMGAALGGGAATSAFGGRGAVTFLSKVTAICAGLFFLTSLGLSFVGVKGSVAADGDEEPAAAAPATPAASQDVGKAEASGTEAATKPAPAQGIEQPAGVTPPPAATETSKGTPAPAGPTGGTTAPAAPAPAPAAPPAPPAGPQK